MNNAPVENTRIKIGWSFGFWLSLLSIVLVAVILRAKLLNSFPLSADEGIHLIWLRLLSAGYRPYEQVYITYPPLYPLMLETVWYIWPGEAAQRWLSVGFTIFGVVGIALLARQFAGPITAIVTTLLLLFSPTLFESSRAILGEFPAVAWSVWAVWLAWLYREQGRRIWLMLSGLCLAASLLTKLLSPFLVVLIPLIVLARWSSINSGVPVARTKSPTGISVKLGSYTLTINDYKAMLIDGLIWGGTVLLGIILVTLMFNLQAFYTQVINQRLEARVAYAMAGDGALRWKAALEFFQDDIGLVVLALAGLVIAWGQRQKDLWLMLVWLVLALTMLLVHTPLRSKHFLILLPHLTIFGGLAVAYWLTHVVWWVKSKKRTTSLVIDKTVTRTSFIAVSGLILLAALLLWQIPTTLALWQAKASIPQPPADEAEALAFMKQVLAPNDCIISDDMQLLYWSNRMLPPELAEVSTNRLISGALTVAELAKITDRYDCQLVAAVSNRISKFLPDYMEWVKRKYIGRFHYGEDDLYFAKIDTDPAPATPLWADFAGQIIFHGYTLPQTPATPGDRLPLTLIWQAQTPLETDYAIFVQLRNAAQTVLASADHQPYLGLVPTSTWPKGAVIQETTWLQLPLDIPPGSYNLYIGWYNPHDLQRLPLANDTSGENALILGPLMIQ